MPRLLDVVDALSVGDDWRQFYDRATDEIVCVSEDEFSDVELYDDGAELAVAVENPQWHSVTGLELMLRIVRDDGSEFVELPSQWEVNEHGIMEEFTRGLAQSPLRERLWNDLHRAGAVRHFKDGVDRAGIAQAWYAYRDEGFSQVASEWADDNDITLTE